MKLHRKSLEVALIACNAALYAAVGLATYFGIFTPVFGTVRFWPAVIIPATFSILFSPKIGAMGAAIGIFISDMFVHGNPILSLTVGVTSNFICFYLIGMLFRRSAPFKRLFSTIVQAIPLLLVIAAYTFEVLDITTFHIYIFICLLVLLTGISFAFLKPKYSSFIYASSSGLMIGSAIIGIGLWTFSQFASLPFGVSNAPLVAALVWFLWTYLTEIPFLVFILPPLVYSITKIIPDKVSVHAL